MALAVLLAVVSLTSCSTTGQGADAGVGGKGITYRLRGEGPDGTWFDWKEVDSQYIALTELRRGEWTLYAEKLDEDGRVVAKGEISTFVSEEVPLADIAFSSDGLGDVSCTLSWVPEQCRDARVEVYLRSADGEWYPRPEAEVSVTGSGSAVWNAYGVNSGSYVARFVLFDGEEEIAGAATAVRVVDGYTSFGDVDFRIGYLGVPYGVRIGSEPLFLNEGSITVEEGCAVYRDGEGVPAEVTWFINGSEISRGNALSLKTTMDRDYYRLDAVKDGNMYSSASATVIVHSTGAVELANTADSSVGFRSV